MVGPRGHVSFHPGSLWCNRRVPGAPSRETPPQPRGARRPAPPRRAARPCTASSYPPEKPVSRATWSPRPRPSRGCGACGREHRCGGARSAAAVGCENQTSPAPRNPPRRSENSSQPCGGHVRSRCSFPSFLAGPLRFGKRANRNSFIFFFIHSANIYCCLALASPVAEQPESSALCPEVGLSKGNAAHSTAQNHPHPQHPQVERLNHASPAPQPRAGEAWGLLPSPLPSTPSPHCCARTRGSVSVGSP